MLDFAKAAPPGRWPGVYGLNWWRNGRHPDGRRKWPGAPESTFAASGYDNNDMFVIPDWKMVIVRLGLDQPDHQITDREYGEFLARGVQDNGSR